MVAAGSTVEHDSLSWLMLMGSGTVSEITLAYFLIVDVNMLNTQIQHIE